MPDAVLELFVRLRQGLREESVRMMHVPEHPHVRMLNCPHHCEQVLQACEVTVGFEQYLNPRSFRMLGKGQQTLNDLSDDLLARLDVWDTISEHPDGGCIQLASQVDMTLPLVNAIADLSILVKATRGIQARNGYTALREFAFRGREPTPCKRSGFRQVHLPLDTPQFQPLVAVLNRPLDSLLPRPIGTRKGGEGQGKMKVSRRPHAVCTSFISMICMPESQASGQVWAGLKPTHVSV